MRLERIISATNFNSASAQSSSSARQAIVLLDRAVLLLFRVGKGPADRQAKGRFENSTTLGSQEQRN